MARSLEVREGLVYIWSIVGHPCVPQHSGIGNSSALASQCLARGNFGNPQGALRIFQRIGHLFEGGDRVFPDVGHGRMLPIQGVWPGSSGGDKRPPERAFGKGMSAAGALEPDTGLRCLETSQQRREWDSNPRRLAPHGFSRAAHLSALPSLPARVRVAARHRAARHETSSVTHVRSPPAGPGRTGAWRSRPAAPPSTQWRGAGTGRPLRVWPLPRDRRPGTTPGT